MMDVIMSVLAVVVFVLYMAARIAFAAQQGRDNVAFKHRCAPDAKVLVPEEDDKVLVVEADAKVLVEPVEEYLAAPENYAVLYRKIIRDRGYIHEEAKMWGDREFCEYVVATTLEDRNWNEPYSEDWKFYDMLHGYVSLRGLGVVSYA